MGEKHEKNAKVFKAFCDENRLAILEMLQRGEICACHLLQDLSIGQSTLSHHMAILCESGVVTPRKDGKWTYYSIDVKGSKKAIALLQQITKRSENYTASTCDQ